MASVNFSNGKLKGAKHAKAIFRHCDKDERLIHEHSNAELDKDETENNTDLKGLSYADLCRAYDERIGYLDANGNGNIRKDRVTCFSLDIPTPEALDEDEQETWFARVGEILSDQYGEKNFLDMKIHRDEIHNYIDAETGKERASRVHAHAFLIPERDGGLNGKWFSSKANMKKLNDSIHAMSVSEFNCPFMDGTKMKSTKSVETLKNASREAEIKARFAQVRQREADARDKEAELGERERRTHQHKVALTKREKGFEKMVNGFSVEAETAKIMQEIIMKFPAAHEVFLKKLEEVIKEKVVRVGKTVERKKKGNTASGTRTGVDAPSMDKARKTKELTPSL